MRTSLQKLTRHNHEFVSFSEYPVERNIITRWRDCMSASWSWYTSSSASWRCSNVIVTVRALDNAVTMAIVATRAPHDAATPYTSSSLHERVMTPLIPQSCEWKCDWLWLWLVLTRVELPVLTERRFSRPSLPVCPVWICLCAFRLWSWPSWLVLWFRWPVTSDGMCVNCLCECFKHVVD